MSKTVTQVVQSCSACDRVKAGFRSRSPQLHPLPIRGLFYRWGVDLCGDFVQTKRGNSYIMICVEHFSKWVEVIPIPDKSSNTIATAFLQHVLSRFLAPAEVLTDQGREFQGEFEALLRKAHIDHRTTSRDYPQADGLAERMVQVLKVQLQKYCLEKNPTTWDDWVPWIAMGYRATKHASLLNYSPYFLLFGREPLFTPRVRAQMEPPLDLDHEDTWFQTILRRSRIFESVMPVAMNNLAIAQHRDTLRYAHTRSGLYAPRPYKFKKGDYVYIRRKTLGTLDVPTMPLILRVKNMKDNMIELEGRDKVTYWENQQNCAPCFLPNLDPTQDPTLQRYQRRLQCKICHS